MHMLAPEYV